MTSPGSLDPADQRITRDDIEQSLRAIQTGVEGKVRSKRTRIIQGAVVGAVVLDRADLRARPAGREQAQHHRRDPPGLSRRRHRAQEVPASTHRRRGCSRACTAGAGGPRLRRARRHALRGAARASGQQQQPEVVASTGSLPARRSSSRDRAPTPAGRERHGAATPADPRLPAASRRRMVGHEGAAAQPPPGDRGRPGRCGSTRCSTGSASTARRTWSSATAPSCPATTCWATPTTVEVRPVISGGVGGGA